MLDGCPDWLKKWTAATLEFIKDEESYLPAELDKLTDKSGNKIYPSLQMIQVVAIIE